MDKGAIWENFVVVERLKWLQARGLRPNRFFWRTLQQAEVDYVEESDGQIKAFEFKWTDKKNHPPVAFMRTYPNAVFEVIHTGNFETFISEE